MLLMDKIKIPCNATHYMSHVFGRLLSSSKEGSRSVNESDLSSSMTISSSSRFAFQRLSTEPLSFSYRVQTKAFCDTIWEQLPH